MTFTGSCHCGRIAYEVDEEPPTKAMSCNCSICRRKEPLNHVTTADKFTLKGSRKNLTSYAFHKHIIEHLFCKHCGCALFCEIKAPDGKMLVEINLRCADDIDLSKLDVTEYDGAKL